MSLGMDYGDEYQDYLDSFDYNNPSVVPMSFNDWLQDKQEQAEFKAESDAEDRGTPRE